MDLTIRLADIADAEQIAYLVTALGYPTSPGQMSKRLERVLADEDYSTLVASDLGQIVGFIGARVGALYESDDYYGQIMALAVSPDQQRRGFGRHLLKAAEALLIERGARVLVVNSGNRRTDAHTFYEKNGYAFTARRYKRSITRVS